MCRVKYFKLKYVQVQNAVSFFQSCNDIFISVIFIIRAAPRNIYGLQKFLEKNVLKTLQCCCGKCEPVKCQQDFKLDLACSN